MALHSQPRAAMPGGGHVSAAAAAIAIGYTRRDSAPRPSSRPMHELEPLRFHWVDGRDVPFSSGCRTGWYFVTPAVVDLDGTKTPSDYVFFGDSGKTKNGN